MATITGTLRDFTDGTNAAATLDVNLCNYGPQIPRSGGIGLFADVALKSFPIASDGTFSFAVAGNDVIEPSGTYYVVTVKDENGDIVQCNAYIFLNADSYDLNGIDPFDPVQQPPPVLPPLIISQLQIIAQGVSNPEYDADQYTAFELTLTTDVTGATITNIIPGNLYTFITVQDATGNHAFTYPGEVANASPINQTPNSTTTQTFIANSAGVLYPVAAGTWS
jgi:hypothetical protein